MSTINVKLNTMLYNSCSVVDDNDKNSANGNIKELSLSEIETYPVSIQEPYNEKFKKEYIHYC